MAKIMDTARRQCTSCLPTTRKVSHTLLRCTPWCHEGSERRLLHTNAWCTLLAPFRQNFTNQGLDGVRICRNTRVLRVSCWEQDYFIGSKNKLRKIANNSIATVRREEAFSGTLESVLSYARAFEEDYGVIFFNMRMLDISEDMNFSEFSIAGSKAALYVNLELARLWYRTEVSTLFLRSSVRTLQRQKTVASRISMTAASLFFLGRLSFPWLQTAVALVKNDHKPTLCTRAFL